MPGHDQDDRSAGERLRAMWARIAKSRSEFILSRAYGLLVSPNAEWEQIRREETTLTSLFMGYVAPVAAAPTFAGMLGQLIFGERAAQGVIARPDFVPALMNAVITCVSVIALVYLMGLLINLVAEQFDGDRDELAAMKASAYTPTPVLVTGLAAIYPPLWWVGLLGVAASAFLLYRGLPILMRAPRERALAYATTVMIVALIALLVIMMLSACVMGAGRL